MKPIIGISVDCRCDPQDSRTGGKLALNWNYAEAVERAGGVPILIPPMADMESVASLIDGWIIPGGDDIDAARYGEPNHPKADLQDPARYEGELKLFQSIPQELPVLGICYGCQFINVARGGTLIQHLPDDVDHERHTGGTLETYRIDRSRLQDIIGSEVTGKSYHHQAVQRLGSGLNIVGKAEDGTVEAIEATDRPWLIGVQWHPERTGENGASQRLFAALIDAARLYRENRRLAGVR